MARRKSRKKRKKRGGVTWENENYVIEETPDGTPPGIILRSANNNPKILLEDIRVVTRENNSLIINENIELEFNAGEDINRWQTYLTPPPPPPPAEEWTENHERPGNEAGGFTGGNPWYDALNGGGRRRKKRRKRRQRTRHRRGGNGWVTVSEAITEAEEESQVVEGEHWSMPRVRRERRGREQAKLLTNELSGKLVRITSYGDPDRRYMDRQVVGTIKEAQVYIEPNIDIFLWFDGDITSSGSLAKPDKVRILTQPDPKLDRFGDLVTRPTAIVPLPVKIEVKKPPKSARKGARKGGRRRKHQKKRTRRKKRHRR